VIIWILLALVAVMGGGYLAYRRSQPKQIGTGEGGAAALLERTLRDVRPNDVVQHAGRDYLVEGVVSYDEDGHTWRGARLADGGTERWMLIGLERGSAMTVRLLDVARGVELNGYPPETLEVSGTPYKLSGRGTATATFQGDLEGLPSPTGGEGGSARCRWWKYAAAGEKTLVVEQWGETYRTLTGETVRPDDVDLLGAS
jgi:hypothetical protein